MKGAVKMDNLQEKTPQIMVGHHITNQFSEFERYSKIVEHLKYVVDNIDDIPNTDTNDIYELVYIEEEIKDWLDNGVENHDINKDLKELLNQIDKIKNTLSKQQLVEIQEHKVKDLSHMNKLKYNDRKRFDGIIDKKEKDIHDKTMSAYFKRSIIGIGIIGAIMFLLYSGNMVELASKITSATTDAIVGSEDMTVNQFLERLKNLISGGLGVALALPLTVFLMRYMLNAAYIAIPYLRVMIDEINNGRGLVGEDTKKLIEDYSFVEEPKRIELHHRIDTAKTLLNNLAVYAEQETDDSKRNKVQSKINIINNLIANEDIYTKMSGYARAELEYTKLQALGEEI